MDLGLADRVYVITGASRGLGLASARALVAEGARVVVAGRDRFCGLRADGTAMCWGPWGEPLLVPEKVAP